jgi:oligoendopeptidase F
MECKSFSDFHRWLQRLNELEAVVSEEAAWNFIHFTQNTQNEASKAAYERYITEVQPRLAQAGTNSISATGSRLGVRFYPRRSFSTSIA